MYNNFRDVLYNTDVDAVYAVTHTYVYYKQVAVCVRALCVLLKQTTSDIVHL